MEGLESFDNVAAAWRKTSPGRATAGRVVGDWRNSRHVADFCSWWRARRAVRCFVGIPFACPWCLFKSWVACDGGIAALALHLSLHYYPPPINPFPVDFRQFSYTSLRYQVSSCSPWSLLSLSASVLVPLFVVPLRSLQSLRPDQNLSCDPGKRQEYLPPAIPYPEAIVAVFKWGS